MKYLLFATLFICVLNCHYTCSTCVGNYYLNCTQCNHGQLQVVYDSAIGSTQLFPVHIFSGPCSQILETVNVFGILSLFGGLIAWILTMNRQCIIFFSSLQDLCFLSLIEIAYINPLQYMMNGLQYTLIFSVSSASIKQTDNKLQRNYAYHLQKLLGTSSLIENGKVIQIFLCVILLIAFVLYLVKQYRKKDKKRNKLIDQKLNSFLLFLSSIFYFLIAEQILIIGVNFGFNQEMATGQIILAIFYFVLIIYYFIYLYYNPLRFYDSKILSYFNCLKKLLYPIIIFLNLSFIYTLPIIMLLFTLVELIYQWKFLQLKNKKIFQYKSIQTFVISQYILYQIITISVNTYVSSLILSILITLTIICFSLVPWLQVYFTLYQLVKKRSQVKVSNINTTTIEQLGQQLPNKMMMTEFDIQPSMEIQKNLNLEEKIEISNNNNTSEKEKTNSKIQIIFQPGADEQFVYNLEEGDKKKQQGDKKIVQEQTTVKNQNEKDKVIAMIGLTQKSPKRRKIAKEKQSALKLAYGLK